MEKRTKITLIVLLLVVIGLDIAIPLEVKMSGSSSIELEVWPHLENSTEAPLIQYDANNLTSSLAWSNRLNEFLKEYRTDSQQPLPQHTGGVERVSCSFNNKVLGDKQVCDVPLDDYYPCASNDLFRRASPCLFFRLNKIRNWTPVTYNNSQDLPQNTSMPKDLKEHIDLTRNGNEKDYVWLSCDGEDPADKEFIGPLVYYPNRGFPSYYFPYTNKEGYLSPIVAVRLMRPQTGILIKMVCKVWAKNIINDKDEEGTVHVSLLIDN